MTKLSESFRSRYLDVLASIYIYNEHRGYTSLDRVLEGVRARCPDDHAFIAEVERHRADEEKHYYMFRRWFERQGRMPLAVDHSCGHIDRFIERIFGCTIEHIDTSAIIEDPAEFEKLCRVIMLTEQRGFAQVEILLRSSIIRSDPIMNKIFQIIHKDEPDHFLPYQHWLERQGKQTALWRERLADFWIHKSLMLVKLPALFFGRSTPRLERWPDEDGGVYAH
jgi:hypothetical protein